MSGWSGGWLDRFRTWQIRRCPFGIIPPVRTPIWYASSTSTSYIAGEIINSPGRGLMEIMLFLESPLGTEVKVVVVTVERLSYRSTP